jgi:hypothetical protein
MEKIIRFYPAYDQRNVNPSLDYGFGGVEMRMVLKGDKGAVQFVMDTGWYLPNIKEYARILPIDLGVHSLTPLYEGQEVSSASCEYCDGKPCYYNGSINNAYNVYEKMLTEGDSGVWQALEDYYNEVFGGKDVCAQIQKSKKSDVLKPGDMIKVIKEGCLRKEE